MLRTVFVILIGVFLSPVLIAQEAGEEASPWSFNYMVQFTQAEVQRITGHPQPEANATGTTRVAPWLHLQRGFGKVEEMDLGLRFGVGWLHSSGQAWTWGQQIELHEDVLLLPLQLLLTTRSWKDVRLSVGVGPYVSFVLDQTIQPMPGVVLSDNNRVTSDINDKTRFGMIGDIALTWSLNDSRSVSLGYRFVEDQTWFDMANAGWIVSGMFIAVEGPAF